MVYYPSHGGEPQEVHPVFCFVFFFARIATLAVRSAKFIEVKLRKQAKYEPIYHNIELRNTHVATNCVSAAGAPRAGLRPKCALFLFFYHYICHINGSHWSETSRAGVR